MPRKPQFQLPKFKMPDFKNFRAIPQADLQKWIMAVIILVILIVMLLNDSLTIPEGNDVVFSTGTSRPTSTEVLEADLTFTPTP